MERPALSCPQTTPESLVHTHCANMHYPMFLSYQPALFVHMNSQLIIHGNKRLSVYMNIYLRHDRQGHGIGAKQQT